MNLRSFPHNDARVIETNISGWTVTKILVDNGSLTDIIFASAFDQIEIDRKLLQPFDTPLIGFGGKRLPPWEKSVYQFPSGTWKIPARSMPPSMSLTYYPYNVILGRGFLITFEAIIHQTYLCMKMSAAKGVINVHGNQQGAQDIERGIAREKRMFTI